MRLDITVHNALTVAEVKRLEQLVHVVADIIILKPRIQGPEVGIVDALKYEAGRLALAIPDHIQQGDDIGPSSEILEDFDLTLDLLLLDWLQHLNDAFLVVDNVDALEHLRVFSAA